MQVSKSIDYRVLSHPNNRTPGVWPENPDVASAPFIEMVNKLFGTQGPLAKYKLVSIRRGPEGGAHFVFDVQGASQAGGKQNIYAIIQKVIDDNIHLNGWTFEVEDSKGVQPSMQTGSSREPSSGSVAISGKPEVQIGQPKSGNVVEVRQVRIEGDELIANIRYGGGFIKKHVFELYWRGGFLESIPVQTTLVLVDKTNDPGERD